MMNKPPRNHRRFLTIDKNYVYADRAVGYCKYKKGVLTGPICRLHKCSEKFNGCPCKSLILFKHVDDYEVECPYKGEEYRKRLGKHGRKKGRSHF